eukprot:m.541650 g.541650  ORF g.541650 m.541650 type:complete len:90 (-) comp22111_c1_seq4:979-1248(-)
MCSPLKCPLAPTPADSVVGVSGVGSWLNTHFGSHRYGDRTVHRISLHRCPANNKLRDLLGDDQRDGRVWCQLDERWRKTFIERHDSFLG